MTGRKHIAHQGVHLRATIAGENSLEALRLAARARFECVEMDVRLSRDDEFVVMHDETLNRTCLDRHGGELTELVPVWSRTLDELREGYVLRARESQVRERIPTLREYLEEARRLGILPFIELKLHDQPRRVYDDLLDMASEILGRDGFVITSNNNANLLIRGLGVRDVTLMGILYQTTFEEIEGLGGTIMAISLTRFDAAEHAALARRAHEAGILTETHVDTMAMLAWADERGIEYLSTDVIAPDAAAEASVVFAADLQAAAHDGLAENGVVTLDPGQRLTVASPEVPFGAAFLEMRMSGACDGRFAGQEFTVDAAESTRVRHQLLLSRRRAELSFVARSACVIESIGLKVTEL
ncbi:glycerophosphodiester phosphodiesterase [Microbacterium murale]|uniref:GP-PDE domain-containing protein n=1 Tax=Microbacterium murale TaxID=1081040 RepID=A0ABQ1RGT4_9MICO|nr:glycerophosphodiester phosphodiesterase family protein [Microbacterium murale]GGD69344.1 hypothetical protein GCM10007269_10570 [Microbacterium murale]